MVVIRLQGGLGNQMFQYAHGKSLAEKRSDELFLDTTFYKRNYGSETKRCFRLSSLNISAKRLPETFLYKRGLGDTQGMISKIWIRIGSPLLRSLYNVLYIKEKEMGIRSNQKKASSHNGIVYLDGYWQNPTYFSSIRQILTQNLSLPSDKLSKFDQILRKINSDQSVLIQVRRGDYVTDSKTKSQHGVIGIDFYSKAIDYIKSKIESPVFYISSNDPVWCKKHIAPLVKDSKIIFLKDRGLKDYQEMMMAKHAKHFIISNSTYGWWPAWLSENSNKIIIAPEQWYADKEMNQQCKIKPESWIEM